jgi:hypothetical protein
MDLQIQELRNNIIEEVILKNHKLLQFVEKEMNQMKDEIKLLKDKIESLKNENTVLKINENKLITNDTIVIGCNDLAEVVLSNIVTLVPHYNLCDDLAEFIKYIQYTKKTNIFMTKKVFKHLNKLNKFKTFSINKFLEIYSNMSLIDENLFRIELWTRITYDNDLQRRESAKSLMYDFNTLCINIKYNHIKQNWKILLDILDECNIKLTINEPEKCFDKSLRDLILS